MLAKVLGRESFARKNVGFQLEGGTRKGCSGSMPLKTPLVEPQGAGLRFLRAGVKVIGTRARGPQPGTSLSQAVREVTWLSGIEG